MTFDCVCGWTFHLNNTKQIACPQCGKDNLFIVDGMPPTSLPAPDPKLVAEQGRKAWAALHAYPAEHAGDWDWAAAQLWYLTEWLPMVPRYCDCQRHWSTIAKAMPPRTESVEAFKQWAIDAHNEVNRRLGKPIWRPS